MMGSFGQLGNEVVALLKKFMSRYAGRQFECQFSVIVLAFPVILKPARLSQLPAGPPAAVSRTGQSKRNHKP